ncbi:hypothetical protein KY284_028094 [Solanum tuberosum]|nr:hypothetical protein KY284_028094 [Solanum tuberosum]
MPLLSVMTIVLSYYKSKSILQWTKFVDSNVKDLTFPQGVPWANGVDRALIVAQLSHFDCGGIALSVCLSHKIGDGSSVYCFLRDWAALT